MQYQSKQVTSGLLKLNNTIGNKPKLNWKNRFAKQVWTFFFDCRRDRTSVRYFPKLKTQLLRVNLGTSFKKVKDFCLNAQVLLIKHNQINILVNTKKIQHLSDECSILKSDYKTLLGEIGKEFQVIVSELSQNSKKVILRDNSFHYYALSQTQRKDTLLAPASKDDQKFIIEHCKHLECISLPATLSSSQCLKNPLLNKNKSQVSSPNNLKDKLDMCQKGTLQNLGNVTINTRDPYLNNIAWVGPTTQEYYCSCIITNNCIQQSNDRVTKKSFPFFEKTIKASTKNSLFNRVALICNYAQIVTEMLSLKKQSETVQEECRFLKTALSNAQNLITTLQHQLKNSHKSLEYIRVTLYNLFDFSIVKKNCFL
ncbi:hypothetical protein RFI_00198 [Reticulomyxa filosa]|uniref:Uncharacterized protein n=1 Tax=Reticulomyxa filosa TaxID=46433 RepID=X6PFR1_RETFI|nr:hypothetical protein RFI_00198 [Reticulomyxa filosa]|eukprot:ETO36864.1 hypothetical protein RFI_00198 [Reticulomyxa filosa]